MGDGLKEVSSVALIVMAFLSLVVVSTMIKDALVAVHKAATEASTLDSQWIMPTGLVSGPELRWNSANIAINKASAASTTRRIDIAGKKRLVDQAPVHREFVRDLRCIPDH